MPTSTFVRRSMAVLASGGAATALALVPATGAHAQVKAEFLGVGSADASFVGSGGGDCNLTSGDGDVTTTPVTFSHGSKTAKVSLNATYTNSLDSSDAVTVKASATTTLTLKRAHGNLSSFDLATGGKATISHTVAPSQCRASVLIGGGIGEALFTESKKGYLYFTRDTKQNAFTVFVLINTKTDEPVAEEVFAGDQSHSTSRALRKPGKYELEETETAITAGGGELALKSESPRTAKVTRTVHLSGQFKPIKKKHHHH
jgi:hypothetical protein